MKAFCRYFVWLFFAICFMATGLYAQNNTRIDRIKSSLDTASSSDKVSLLNDLAFEYRTSNPVKTIELVNEALAIAAEVGNRSELPRSYNFIGLAHFNNSRYSEALKYFDIGTEHASQMRDSVELGFSYQLKAGVYRWMGDLRSAMENALEAKVIFEKINHVSGRAYSYGTLSDLYIDQNEPGKAIEYSSKALELLENEGSDSGLPTILLSHADVLAYQKKYSDAFSYYSDAHRLYNLSGHQRGMLITNIRMATMYSENGDPRAARVKLAKARSIHEKFHINTELTSLHLLEGRLLLADSEPGKAALQLQKAKTYAIEANRRKDLSEIYRLLAITYEVRQDHGNSLNYLKQHQVLKDSLFNESVAKKIAKYESDIALAKQHEKFNQLELEKAKSDQKLEAATRFRIGLGLIALLLACIILIVYRSYRMYKKSSNLLGKKNEKINKQAEILQKQAKELREAQAILEETNEKLEEKVKIRTTELSRSNSDLERFAFIASHDMKEPLRTITSFSQLLKKELSKEGFNKKKVEDYLNYITSGTLNMNMLVQDLLTYSKLKDSPEEPFTELCFDNILNAVLGNLDSQIRANRVTFEFNNLPSSIEGIEVMMIQLFQNLISNAIKFKKPDVPCKIKIKALESHSEWIFSVIDNGIGIHPQYHKRIFELFRKLHSRMQYEGSGIGLSICKRIIELHNGSIWLESKKGEGTSFHFSIPKVLKPKALEVTEEGELVEISAIPPK